MPRHIASIEDHYRLERTLLANPAGLSLADLHRATGVPVGTLRDHLHTMSAYRRAETVESTGGALWRPSPTWLVSLLRELAEAS